MNIQQFNFDINLLQVLLWEYNDATALQSLLEQKQAWYVENHTQFWQDWFSNIFNLETANDFGLSVWAILLNVPLIIEQPTQAKVAFGFGPYRANFNNGNFSNAGSGIGLTTDEKRLVLRLRYYQLVSRGSTTQTNQALQLVFENLGTVYVLDGLNMTMSCVFLFTPSAKLKLILETYDLIPRPSTVLLRYTDATYPAFGFGPYRKNFNNGNFRGSF